MSRLLIHAVRLTALVLILAAFITPTAAADGEPPIFFPETGHTVREPFVGYFKAHAAVTRFGYPITDDFVDPRTGLLVQYFQNARLEWHPANPDPYKVQLGLLGEEIGRRAPPLLVSLIPSPSDPNCVYFGETGHSACYRYLDYWRANGGLDMFGYPTTEADVEPSGLMVQYFQRARMEWHPEKPPGQTIQLTPLGTIAFDKLQLPPGLKAPRVDSAAPAQREVTELHARGSVLVPVSASAGSQTGFVYVIDQFGKPVSGASVTMVVRYPDGPNTFILPPTGEGGLTFQSFSISHLPSGTLVPIKFLIAFPGFESETRTSFMVW